MKSLGDQIIEQIIKGGLMSAQCAEDQNHPCIIVWSSGAAEQIEAIVMNLLQAKPE
jgi:hypothetical protein